jgi:hypothetical protein
MTRPKEKLVNQYRIASVIMDLLIRGKSIANAGQTCKSGYIGMSDYCLMPNSAIFLLYHG